MWTWVDWDDARPGFVEIDLVGHEGGDPSGDFAQTLAVTDIATGWTENCAVKNKAQEWVFAALDEITAARLVNVATRTPLAVHGHAEDHVVLDLVHDAQTEPDPDVRETPLGRVLVGALGGEQQGQAEGAAASTTTSSLGQHGRGRDQRNLKLSVVFLYASNPEEAAQLRPHAEHLRLPARPLARARILERLAPTGRMTCRGVSNASNRQSSDEAIT